MIVGLVQPLLLVQKMFLTYVLLVSYQKIQNYTKNHESTPRLQFYLSWVLKTCDGAGLSEQGVTVGPLHPQVLEDQFTLSQPGGADYAYHFPTGTPELSNMPTALRSN